MDSPTPIYATLSELSSLSYDTHIMSLLHSPTVIDIIVYGWIFKHTVKKNTTTGDYYSCPLKNKQRAAAPRLPFKISFMHETRADSTLSKHYSSPCIRIHSHNHAELMLTNFKTATEYKQIHYPTIPIPLLRIILQSLQESPRTYLFESARHTPLTRNRYSQMASHTLQQIFGVPLNLTMIRHIFISTLSMDTPLIELKRIGELMGHSLTQQRLYQWKHLHNQQDDDDDPTIARTIS